MVSCDELTHWRLYTTSSFLYCKMDQKTSSTYNLFDFYLAVKDNGLYEKDQSDISLYKLQKCSSSAKLPKFSDENKVTWCKRVVDTYIIDNFHYLGCSFAVLLPFIIQTLHFHVLQQFTDTQFINVACLVNNSLIFMFSWQRSMHLTSQSAVALACIICHMPFK